MSDTRVSEIRVERLTEEQIKALGTDTWTPWECEPKTFDWHYDDNEDAYVFEGRVKVKTPQGEVEFGAGDVVHFPKGLSCTWHVIEKIRKVYRFT